MMDKSVRITGGEYRGQKIATPGDGTHPMGERERLALFNMLTNQIAGASVLDLYAGGGTLGLEAISRGAKKAVFVEKNHKAASMLRENIAKLGADELCTVVTEDVRTYIGTTNQEFDIVFADPPYDKYESAFTSGLADLVGDDGILMLSHPGDAPLLPGLSLLKTRQYAGAHLSFYQKDV
jgi:16S rRNA (guanine966-N2)-methyltransferase